MSEQWYLMNTSNIYYSGDEYKEFTDYASGAFDELLQVSPEAYNIKFENKIETVIVQNESDENWKNYETRNILSRINILRTGLIFKHKSYQWIIASKIPDDNRMYQKSVALLCNYNLKWLDTYKNEYSSMVAIAQKSGTTTDNIDIGKTIIEPDTLLSIILPYNDKTKTIMKDLRFFIGENVYKVTNVESVLNEGVISVVCMFDAFQEGRDNKEKGLADYYTQTNNYSVDIQNNDISINIGDNIQLQTVVKKDASVITNEPLVWESSNETICKVNNNGLLSALGLGECIVTARLKNNLSIMDNVNVEVKIVAHVSHIELSIIGSGTIPWGMKKNYKAQKVNNGSIVDTKFNFSIDCLGNNSDIAILSVIDDSNVQVTIKKDTKLIGKQIKLIAISKEDTSEKVEKIIEIVALGS